MWVALQAGVPPCTDQPQKEQLLPREGIVEKRGRGKRPGRKTCCFTRTQLERNAIISSLTSIYIYMFNYIYLLLPSIMLFMHIIYAYYVTDILHTYFTSQ